MHTAESNQGKYPATIDAYSRALRRITHHFDTNKRQWINWKNQYLFNTFPLANVWRARLLSHITDTLNWRYLVDYLRDGSLIVVLLGGGNQLFCIYLNTYTVAY
ncbi:hypothetical protein C9J12_05135 [Photobacterium frigidiphilum]|uniref:Uncharacterized protein n=1 Tax=Photobacterium frigidiphilum TaxID=264736 RepID=A0A2T3JM78_9GAMM|nr:hypothetical protein [Photobacterium frigidiphilum]PSU50127.1 hypothetical protein C9J12_05135 [Photobacterium frigidiphilum]